MNIFGQTITEAEIILDDKSVLFYFKIKLNNLQNKVDTE